ncbi:MAG: ATP-binding domain-containing protein [Deltaproteobacteria bacterium]|nr:ATP-binding domain-containing protein [Deltaproteobacteria bacterium]
MQKASPTLEALSTEDKEVVLDELEMAGRVATRIAKSMAEWEERRAQKKEAPTGPSMDDELTSLRDQINEARTEDVPALLSEMMRLAAMKQVDRPQAEGAVDPANPYFGHLRLEENGRKRDVLIGKRGMLDREAGVVIVDWRNAPVSRIYYRYEEGDDYEEEFGEDIREGEVLVRRTVSFEEGDIVRMKTADNGYILKRNGDEHIDEWIAIGKPKAIELGGGAGVASRAPKSASRRQRRKEQAEKRGQLGHHGPEHLRSDKHLPEIAALIDPRQFDAMTQTDASVVVLQGGAGSGKTTVALHRIAYLAFQAPECFRPNRMMVVVHQPALVKYVERVLPSLEVGGVRVRSFLDWSRWALSRVVEMKGRRHTDHAPAEVSLCKKHPAMLAAMQAQLRRREDDLFADIEKSLTGSTEKEIVLGLFQPRKNEEPFFVWLNVFEKRVRDASVDEGAKERALRGTLRIGRRCKNLIAEWEELVTDEKLLRESLQRPGEKRPVDDMTLKSFLRWTAQQIEEPDDDDDFEEDDDDKPEVLRRNQEEGEDEGPRTAFDPHDPALLLNLWIARTGDLFTLDKKPIRYDHIAVDEAQDLSAVEMRPLLTATGKAQSMTLAGDIVQKVVFDNGFEEWEELLEQLGARGVEVEPFQLSYRSTAQVVQFAREVLGPLAPAKEPKAVREGAEVDVFAFDEVGEEVAFLADALRALMGREPNANVAVLTRFAERASFYAKMLQEAEVARLRLVGENDEFSFMPGIDVTHIAKVKGLEYDYVLLVEATASMYPAEDAPRHLMHIGATRAAHQLWVTTSTKSPSPLLPKDYLEGAAFKA